MQQAWASDTREPEEVFLKVITSDQQLRVSSTELQGRHHSAQLVPTKLCKTQKRSLLLKSRAKFPARGTYAEETKMSYRQNRSQNNGSFLLVPPFRSQGHTNSVGEAGQHPEATGPLASGPIRKPTSWALYSQGWEWLNHAPGNSHPASQVGPTGRNHGSSPNCSFCSGSRHLGLVQNLGLLQEFLSQSLSLPMQQGDFIP